MNAKSWMMLKVLINRYNPKAMNAVLRFLPESEAKNIINDSIQSTDIMPLLYQPQKMLESMHYSWIEPLVQTFPAPLHPVILASLTPEQSIGLKQLSTRETSKVTVSAPVKTFMLHQLYTLLDAQDKPPLEYLPESDVSFLAKWSKQQLVTLMDFLSLSDLAAELRYIVNRDHLKNIYNCLSSKQLRYLKICLHQKEQIISPKLNINATKQDCNKLKQTLHRRSLIRFAKALSGEHPDLVWYIAHILDRGRGTLLLEGCQPNSNLKVTLALKQHLINVINFIKKE